MGISGSVCASQTTRVLNFLVRHCFIESRHYIGARLRTGIFTASNNSLIGGGFFSPL